MPKKQKKGRPKIVQIATVLGEDGCTELFALTEHGDIWRMEFGHDFPMWHAIRPIQSVDCIP